MADDNWQVLVVDDEPNNLKLLKQILSAHYRLAFAPNGPIALEIVQKVQPDLILLDIMMPEMDGYEVCQRLKADPRTQNTPVIFVTAKSDEDDEAKGFAMGAVDYITKPISAPIVQGRVKNHLELKQAREYLKCQNEILEVRVEERTREILELQQVEFELRSAKERIDYELNLAAQIQKSILPSTFPAFPQHKEFDIYAMMLPAQEIGGDFYDFFLVEDEHLVVIIADVAGKGVPAALFMMNTRTTFRSIAKQLKSPSEVLTEANDLLCVGNETGMFVTAIIAYYHLPTGLLTYSNGGHSPPLLSVAENTYRELGQTHGSVLGGKSGIAYREDVHQFEPGQTLILYTDGVTEARSPNNEFFGLGRLKNFLATCNTPNVSEMCHQLDKSLKNFQQGDQFDDLTVLALRRKV